MIIDFHTHVFPPEVADKREAFVKKDPAFSLVYRDPRAAATALAKLAEYSDFVRNQAVSLKKKLEFQ